MSSPRPPAHLSPRVSVVLPAYNEEQRIGPALDELFAYLTASAPGRAGSRPAGELGSVEVIVVDDGSRDRTAEIVEQRAARLGSGEATLRLLRVDHSGKGGAVRAGMLEAAGELIVFADADMATPPDQLPQLIDALADSDVALGSRIQPDGSDRRASQPFRRRLMGKVFHLLAALWVTGRVPDTQCGFKGFRAPAARDLFGRQRLTSIVFDAEVIHLARRRGYRIVSVPVEWSDKHGSRMHASLGLALRVLVDLLRIPFLHRSVGRA
ncbi:MAG TPA: dolichyl-phosphate beta-glucosyltransferase [Candidatus Limnocylindrales bacterium]|jgi:dolichyl-phosphate beta-glucosyltransferase|nr:dolichyl-phosphate beta-glucosyltransferase [Candidatus Limnocylindrales bacterium]